MRVAIFTCTECGTGTVRPQVLHNIERRFGQIAFVVPEGTVEVCDNCGAKFYPGPELKRWRELFEAEQERKAQVLSASEIRETRETLGLTMTDFAVLIGATRSSVHHWERDDRESAQGRMADLMIRLVREAAERWSVAVLAFLQQRPGVQGVKLALAAPSAVLGAQTRWPPQAYDGVFPTSKPERGSSPRLRIVAGGRAA